MPGSRLRGETAAAAAAAAVAGVLGAAAASYGLSVYLKAVLRALRAEPAGSSVWKAPARPLVASTLPYPPDALPGGRVVESPYGSIQVYEWGPETSEDRVLLLPGISTPVLALGNLGHDLVQRGCRVMMFDLFGRGWSDSPQDVPHDARLYVSQILLVLASSPSWMEEGSGFHLVGYSFGGCLSAAFTRYLPHLVRSLTLITPGGLIRRSHISWKSRLLYSKGVLPGWLLLALVRRRLGGPPAQSQSSTPTATVEAGEGETAQAAVTSRFSGNSDAHGGDSFDHAVLRPDRPDVTVATVCSWQMEAHPGFLPAFMSSLQRAPIYEQHGLWAELAEELRKKRQQHKEKNACSGRVLLVLGSTDPVIVKDELVPDMQAVLGPEAVEVAVIEGGHEIPISESRAIAGAAIDFWSR